MTILRHASRAFAAGGTGLGFVAAYRYREVKREQSNLPSHELWSFEHNIQRTPVENGTKTNAATTTTNENDTKKKMKKKKLAIVIGGGVVGITAAYKLASAGHSVALLEPRSEPGKECSACAAGGMQRSNPVVDRGTWAAVTQSLLLPFTRYILGGGGGGAKKKDNNAAPYKFFHIEWVSALTDPFFLRWSMTFTKTSFFPCEQQSYLQKEMLAFTDYAVKDMIAMMEDEHDTMASVSGYNPNGSLSLSYDDVPSPPTNATTKANTAAKAENITRGKNLEPNQQLNGDDITSREPSLLHQRHKPTSAKFEYESRAASSERFTKELAERCARDPNLDVTFFYDTAVKDIVTTGPSANDPSQKRSVTQLKTNRGVIHIPNDAQVLVAAGAWTPHILAQMDMYAPVYPLKGYAMSVSAEEILQSSSSKTTLEAKDLPSRIVCDKYMYTSRLGDEIRITSIGEFSGWSTDPTPSVEKEFRQEAVRQFPQLEPFVNDAKVMCGHRPYVSDGILLLGRVDSYDNLLVSCGPGSNGWKLAMGSGDIIERLVSGTTEDEISNELGFDARSFSPAGRVVHSPIFTKICRARWGVEKKKEKKPLREGQKDVIGG
eukprot:CAMPEP_0183714122 /NCGR_PEP_ID=MMETSP0737-20130205/8775_1 /TAXON_ID=385413 /ORGANISM="Thalassiosira miniscula, Strain CCMP1093" /LENGTH=603 /DNA_ID=CAMNT_0025943027 /DNA_START=68 /DNA_END=1879 /DNA_ORIENTATION=+